ncbi:hypothetical protein [Variovorax sp. UMC13]|uniref:hypothetical protein n=1 Tax=Variovorax sp. UMC13 TaxID=1862326 RepID=UPI0016011F3E|nr:hypothetical protein [Variovorax sp. UMC13]MBB1600424.1 hypothetical protein [Variovorax sp. UMC13]
MDIPDKYAHIPGWGADLDHANRPAYPRERTPPRLEGVHWDQPSPQPERIEVLTSLEHPVRPPLFGTGPAPAGLSGSIRRYAFGFSENDVRHWLLLLFADRVNVGEGVLGDLARGHVPNLYAEMGGRAELRHNPIGVARKVALLAAVVGMVYVTRKRRSGRRSRTLPQR